jgi:hypothetical protein
MTREVGHALASFHSGWKAENYPMLRSTMFRKGHD